jgi:hypothetical protein
MSKKHFIAIANAIKEHNRTDVTVSGRFRTAHLNTLAAVFKQLNPKFDRDRWLGYIAGDNGPNGGAV